MLLVSCMSGVLTNGDYCLESGLQVADLPLTHAIVKEEFVTLSFGERTRLMNFLAEVLFREVRIIFLIIVLRCSDIVFCIKTAG